jgi:hypothetical protein
VTAVDDYGIAEIEHALAAHIGGRRITRIERVPSAGRSSFFVDDVDVSLDDGTTLELVAKAADRNSMSPEGRAAKPFFLWNAERERACYETVLSPAGIETARYVGSCASIAGARYLLLERVHGVPLWQRGDLLAWREAARWLARLHVRVGAARALGSAAGPHLLRYTRHFYECWIERARQYRADPALEAVAARYPLVVGRLLAEPMTFIHGDFYAANVLITPGGQTGRPGVRPIDWEMASIGPAAIDLACLLAGRWTDDERDDLTGAYWQEHIRLGRLLPSRDEFRKTLDYCLIHLSVRNLGWSRHWTPPPEHAQDWLREAQRLCEKWP